MRNITIVVCNTARLVFCNNVNVIQDFVSSVSMGTDYWELGIVGLILFFCLFLQMQ